MKSVKNLLWFVLGLFVFVLTGCQEPKEELGGITLKYNKSVYNVSMKKALEASSDFVKQSVKSQNSREAFVELTEEDSWQGYIENEYGKNWNVPSNIYGTSLETADNVLKINGEELGSLQEMVFHEDENGNFVKAVFQYKDHLYYVLDYPASNGSYLVLSSEDDYDHICFTQDGKTNSSDFSNFKIWVWDYAADGQLHRRGNLGYAYTLRNVEMLDGSFATVTVSGFNYYHYGFRVWIKETDGTSEKPEYTENTAEESQVFVPQVLNDFVTDGSEDFIYKIVNNTSGKLTVANYIRNVNMQTENINLSKIAVSEDVEIAQGESYEFKYSLNTLMNKYGADKWIGCNFFPENKWLCNGWENSFDYAYNIHTVTVTDSEDAKYCMYGVNSWQVIDKELSNVNVQTFVNAVYSENYSDGWLVDIPTTETTKWKVTEMWFYTSGDKLIYNAANIVDCSTLEEKLQEKIPGCTLMLFPLAKSSYSGWMPGNANYGLCLRLESKNCNVQNVWCETVDTNTLKEVYKMMEDSASDLIRNNQ
ncbi:MAG: hypothetical protein K5829_03550 [Treponema sp.]|nr:hypothetical protein [Treponema sp.]